MPAHGVEHRQGIDQIVGIILQGLGHALSHRLKGGEVDHGVDVRVLCEQGLHPRRVTQVHLDEGHGPSHDPFHPADRLLAGINQIIRHHNVVARLDEFHAGVAADVAGSAADQNRHNVTPSAFFNGRSAHLIYGILLLFPPAVHCG